jgi:hypothetical protein
MEKGFPISRNFILVSLALIVAVIFGYFVAQFFGGAADWLGLGVLVAIIALPALPLFLRWYHPILIFSWNAMMALYFLPGSPGLWMMMAGCCFVIAVLTRATDSKRRFLPAASVTLPLLLLLGVVLITARSSGGFGMRALGGQTFGGRNYLAIIAAVMGYFAFISRAIPLERAHRYAVLFFLPGCLLVMSNVTYALGPKFYFLYNLFPPEFALTQAQADYSFLAQDMVRLAGMSWAGQALFCFLLAKHGIRGIFQFSKWWRLALFIFAIAVAMFGGFRSAVIFLILTFTAMFFLEGAWRTRLLPIMAAFFVVGAAVVLPFIDRMPLAVQRALSFLPVSVDPIVRLDAEGSTQWRVDMWKDVMPEIPRYLIRGKGYAINAGELLMANEMVQRGGINPAIISGDYHNGPLSILIPFGIFGAACFLWFVFASIRGLYFNLKYGDPALKNINTLLLALFVAWFVFFCTVFGGFYADLAHFVGIIGLSIALNGGIKRKQQPAECEALAFAPA